MSNLFIACNNCGSSLQIDEEIAFVTCRDCEKTLEVVRTFNSVYTKVRERQTWEKPVEIVYQSKEIDKNDIYKRIELLENEWENQLPNFMENGQLPDLDSSKTPGRIFFFIFLTVPVISVLLFLSSLFVTINLFFVIFATLSTIIIIAIFLPSKSEKARMYQDARLDYEEKRAALMERLNQ